MVIRKIRQSGSSIVVALVLAAAIGVIGATGSLVYQHNRVNAATNPDTATAASPAYSNNTYGLSYSYPSNWTPSGDVTNDPKTSATRQEFGTGLKLNTATENNNTVEIEILDEPLQTAVAWYDQYYAQTPIKVNKTTGTLKGKQSVQYDFVAPTYETKQYLFAVGSKTYMLSSVNESLNVSASASYWSNFTNTFNSLTIR
jgi:hypothetical protein